MKIFFTVLFFEIKIILIFSFPGFPTLDHFKIPFVPVRKKGKLPHFTLEEVYSLEYGEAVLEIHKDAIKKGQKVLIHDDLLATGGTALAASNLVERLGGVVVGFSFVVNLSFLEGAGKLRKKSQNLFFITTY